jgi:hypothetical protein
MTYLGDIDAPGRSRCFVTGGVGRGRERTTATILRPLFPPSDSGARSVCWVLGDRGADFYHPIGG